MGAPEIAVVVITAGLLLGPKKVAELAKYPCSQSQPYPRYCLKKSSVPGSLTLLRVSGHDQGGHEFTIMPHVFMLRVVAKYGNPVAVLAGK